MKLILTEPDARFVRVLPPEWTNVLAKMRAAGNKEDVTLFFGHSGSLWMVRESALAGYETMRVVGLPSG